MQPLYSQDRFAESKSRTLLPLKCCGCGATFYKQKRLIQSSIDQCRFCSMDCYQQNRSRSDTFAEVRCELCGKKITKATRDIKRTKHNFCNRSCAASYNNANKKHGTRRSKLEKWIEAELRRIYPQLEILFNRHDAINSELDLYIPSLQLAFELNGIFHYEPIYGQDKLDNIQTNDARKFQACLEQQIELCIIDTSSMVYFKTERAEKYLTIVCQLIDQKLSDHLSKS